MTQQKNFTGAEGLWVRIRRDPYFYFLNKVVSIVVATFGACYTLNMGEDVNNYVNDYPDQSNYKTAYWLLFIFFSFQALDELIELYAVEFQREKGALGLLFEVNYVVGLCIGAYIINFLFQGPPEEDKYQQMYMWLYYQVYVLLIVFIVIVLVAMLLRNIQSRQVTQKKDDGKSA